MSFYGNVTYYLSNAFNKIIYRNAASKSENGASADGKLGPGVPAYEYPMIPRNRKDETILETGNKWIVFADPQGTVENNQIKLFHQVVRDNTADVVIRPTVAAPSSDPEETPSSSATDIEFGSTLTLPTITYDNAGHIVNTGTVQYKMPKPQGEEEIDEVRNEIAYVNYLLTGNPGYYEEVPEQIPNDYKPYAYYIMQNRSNIGNWNIGSGTYDDKSTIADTIHELLYRLGLATKIQGQNGYLYELVDETNPNLQYRDGSVLGIVDDAEDSARITRDYARSNRGKLNEIITTIKSLHPSVQLDGLPDN